MIKKFSEEASINNLGSVQYDRPQKYMTEKEKKQAQENIGAFNDVFKNIEEIALANIPISTKSIRFSFDDLNFSPNFTNICTHGKWKKLATHYSNVWDFVLNDDVTSVSGEFMYNNGKEVVFNNKRKGKIINSALSGITNFVGFMQYNSGLTEIWVLDTSTATTLDYAFMYCTGLEKIPDVISCKSIHDSNGLRGIFGYTKIKSLPVFDWDTNTYTSCSARYLAFQNTALVDVVLDCAHINNMQQAFTKCYSLTNCNFTNTSNVTNFKQCFQQCASLTECPIVDVSGATNVESMYSGDDGTGVATNKHIVDMNIAEIPTNFIFNNGSVNIAWMFAGCTNITHIPTITWPTVSDVACSFTNCYNLETGLLSTYNALKTKLVSSSTRTTNCFLNDDKSLDMAYIPESWGGKGPEE